MPEERNPLGLTRREYADLLQGWAMQLAAEMAAADLLPAAVIAFGLDDGEGIHVLPGNPQIEREAVEFAIIRAAELIADGKVNECPPATRPPGPTPPPGPGFSNN